MNDRLPSDALEKEMDAHIGRHADKVPDWDAFPANRGYPELSRSQIRYIGAGGSPKHDDPGTMRPEHFTMSMVFQPPGHYAAAHSHEVQEAFLVLEGVLTVGWEWDGQVVLARLGPRDMILNAPDRPHGFRNDGNIPVLMSIMVGKGRPMPPSYLYHPSTHDPVLSKAFGAKEGTAQRLDASSEDPHHREMARHIIRYSQVQPRRHAAGFARLPYIGEEGVVPGTFTKDLVFAPRGCAVKPYEREVEEAYLVLEGCLSVGWEEGGRRCEKRLGPRDVLLTPPGRRHWFANDGIEDAQFMMVVGSATPRKVDLSAA